jgi:hypothetical protein
MIDTVYNYGSSWYFFMPTVSKWLSSPILKRIASMFAEKPTVKKDDFESEHIIYYHGLVGSSPENLRQYRDVRDDMKLAIQTNSSAQMAINLRIPTQFWAARLKQIVDEINEREAIIRLLTPTPRHEQMTFNDIPLLHDDWRVRSNAAVILAHLNATEASEQLAHSLSDTARNTRAAFVHQAYALGALGQDSGKTALLSFLSDEDPWIRVDSAGALALLTADEICLPLMESLLVRHRLSDYAAVAVARSIPPTRLLNDERKVVRFAGCELINGVAEASLGSFNTDIVTDLALHQTSEQLSELLDQEKSVCLARAALTLGDWLAMHDSEQLTDSFKKTLAKIESPDFKAVVSQRIAELGEKPNDDLKAYKLRCAIYLAGRLGVSELAPQIAATMGRDRNLLDQSIDTLGKLADPSVAADLVRAAGELVDIADRTSQAPSKHPIAEEDDEQRRATTTYYLVIKALGSLPSAAALAFLSKTVKDYAPDIRTESFNSIIAICESGYSPEPGVLQAIKAELSAALGDPAVEVRKSALKGVSLLEVTDCVQKVVALTAAKEVSLTREAFNTLSELAKKGHKQLVAAAAGKGLKTEPDLHKRKALKDFLDTIGG